MNNQNNYKGCFEWIKEQVQNELRWEEGYLKELRDIGISERYSAVSETKGKILAYKSISKLIEKLDKHGYEGYKKICDEVTEKYKEYGEEAD